MPRRAVPWLVVGLAACAGCGGSTTGHKSPVANACSNSAFTDAVSPRLASLNAAVLAVDAGHGDVAALGAAAPGLASTAGLAREAAQRNRPCRSQLMRARALLITAATGLASAGHELELLADAATKGKDYSSFQSQFLTYWSGGSQDLQDALASLRKAGAPRLVSASDGKGIFREAGCGNCHTLAAAGSSSKVGTNLDLAKPSKRSVTGAVTNGQGTMVSFEGTLSAAQILAVADFVGQNAGK